MAYWSWCSYALATFCLWTVHVASLTWWIDGATCIDYGPSFAEAIQMAKIGADRVAAARYTADPVVLDLLQNIFSIDPSQASFDPAVTEITSTEATSMAKAQY